MLAEPQPSARQKLTLQKIEEHRGNMSGFAVFVHGANFSSKKELGASGKRINVGGSQHGDAAWRDEPANVAQKSDWTLHMLDNFNGGDKAEGSRTNFRGKISLVEIQGNMGDICLETIRIAIDGDDVTSERS